MVPFFLDGVGVLCSKIGINLVTLAVLRCKAGCVLQIHSSPVPHDEFVSWLSPIAHSRNPLSFLSLSASLASLPVPMPWEKRSAASIESECFWPMYLESQGVDRNVHRVHQMLL